MYLERDLMSDNNFKETSALIAKDITVALINKYEFKGNPEQRLDEIHRIFDSIYNHVVESLNVSTKD
ncbi:MAG: hypothetical protein K0S75_838 [Clostridia bacterium]|jgi:hypothetical protein|nr:hypothetical protein [Clostridia bacterium]